MVRGLWHHDATMPSMFALLQHGGTARTPGVSQWRRRPEQGRGRRFEGCCFTLRSCPPCSRTCNTEAPHARRASANGAGASRGEGAGSRAVASPCDHALHVRVAATRRHRTHAQCQPMETAPRAGERARVRGLWHHDANMPFMFALLQHGGTARTQGVSQWSRRPEQGRGRSFEGCCVTLRSCPP